MPTDRATLGAMRRRKLSTSLATVTPKVSKRAIASCLAGSLLVLSTFAVGCASAPGVGGAPLSAAPSPWLSPLHRDHELVGKIWDVPTQAFIDRGELERRISAARFVLLGETHDNPDHHRLQAEVIAAATKGDRRPAVVLEMLDANIQSSIDALLAKIPDDVDHFGAAVQWQKTGWPPYAMYRPIFEVALGKRLPIVAAGIGRADAMNMYKGAWQLDPDIAARQGLDQPLPDALRKALLEELVEAHCGHLPEHMVGYMVDIQRARDALLADRLEQTVTLGGGILIAGRGHVRTDRAVPAYLKRRNVVDVLTIGFVEANPESHPPGQDAPYEVVWFTPTANDTDHCEELRRHPKAIKEPQKDWTRAPAPRDVNAG